MLSLRGSGQPGRSGAPAAAAAALLGWFGCVTCKQRACAAALPCSKRVQQRACSLTIEMQQATLLALHCCASTACCARQFYFSTLSITL